MTLIRKTIETVDKKVDAIPTDGSVSGPKVFARAFAWGSLEGAVNGLATLGAVTLVTMTASFVIRVIESRKSE